MPEIPQDASFVKELQYIHIVTIAFLNEERKVETTVWGYHKAEDAQKRFEKIMAEHKANGENSSLLTTETFMVGIYENFEQSEFVASGSHNDKKM